MPIAIVSRTTRPKASSTTTSRRCRNERNGRMVYRFPHQLDYVAKPQLGDHRSKLKAGLLSLQPTQTKCSLSAPACRLPRGSQQPEVMPSSNEDSRRRNYQRRLAHLRSRAASGMAQTYGETTLTAPRDSQEIDEIRQRPRIPRDTDRDRRNESGLVLSNQASADPTSWTCSTTGTSPRTSLERTARP